MPAPLTVGSSRSLLIAPSGDPMRAALVANATRAWYGADATLSAWPCAVTALNAAPSGSGTTLGTLNGRAAVVFSGSGRYVTAAFPAAIAQAYSVVSVARFDSFAADNRFVYDGIGSSNRGALFHRLNFGVATIAAGSTLGGPSAINGNFVGRVTYSGATSAIYVNGSLFVDGDAGTQNLTGTSIGGAFNGVGFFIGPIALVAIVAGADYEARAAAIEAAALSWYGIS